MTSYLITYRKIEKDKYGNFRQREVNNITEFNRENPTRSEIEEFIKTHGVILFMHKLSDF